MGAAVARATTASAVLPGVLAAIGKLPGRRPTPTHTTQPPPSACLWAGIACDPNGYIIGM